MANFTDIRNCDRPLGFTLRTSLPRIHPSLSSDRRDRASLPQSLLLSISSHPTRRGLFIPLQCLRQRFALRRTRCERPAVDLTEYACRFVMKACVPGVHHGGRGDQYRRGDDGWCWCRLRARARPGRGPGAHAWRPIRHFQQDYPQ